MLSPYLSTMQTFRRAEVQFHGFLTLRDPHHGSIIEGTHCIEGRMGCLAGIEHRPSNL